MRVTPPSCIRGSLLLAAAFAAAGLVPAAHAGDWLTLVDETSTRLVADSAVGADDTFEKDLISGDVDKDGDPDLLVGRKVRFSTAGGKSNVLFMNENGVMTDRTATLAPDMLDETDDRDIRLVDVDGDTWLDVVTVTTFLEQPRIYMNLGEDSEGSWLGFDYDATDGRLPAFSPGPKFCAVGVGDVTGNGAPDLYFVDYDSPLEDRLLINNGSGFFTDETSTRLTSAMVESAFGTDAHILDMNGDTFEDIVKNNASGSTGSAADVRILYNDGTGNFVRMDMVYTDAPYMVEVADLDENGRPDIYVVDDLQDVVLYNTGNDGSGNAVFTEQAVTGSPNTEGFGGNTKIADLDLDGLLDILVADVDTDIPGCDRQMTVLQGQGTLPNISYSDPLAGTPRAWTPTGVFDIEVIDIDGNGVPDVWMGICDGNRIFMNTAEAPTVFTDGFESGDTSAWSLTFP